MALGHTDYTVKIISLQLLGQVNLKCLMALQKKKLNKNFLNGLKKIIFQLNFGKLTT
jgi:hypothetical protein